MLKSSHFLRVNNWTFCLQLAGKTDFPKLFFSMSWFELEAGGLNNTPLSQMIGSQGEMSISV